MPVAGRKPPVLVNSKSLIVMSSCIFCKIIESEIPSTKVYEDDLVVAFMDVNPLTDGHCLVVTKEHGETLFDIGSQSQQAVLPAVNKVARAIEKTLECDGFTMGINHKIGQGAPHFHFHIVPRWKGDGGGNLHTIINSEKKQDIAELGKKISENL